MHALDNFEGVQNVNGTLLNLPNNVLEELYTLYPEEDVAAVTHQEKERTFAYVSIPVSKRSILRRKFAFK